MAESRLYDVASTNDVKTLHDLLEKDPFILDRVSYACNNKTPLHVATMKGNFAIVQEILDRNPELAEVLDAQQSLPLHIASAKGYVDIVKILLSAAPDMCLSRDCQGKNSLHLAVMKGRADVVAEVVRVSPLAAQERVDRGRTVLHLCVQHHQLESLKILVHNSNEQLVNAKDDDGNSIMHLAVRDKQIEVVRYLVESNKVDMNAVDSNGLTAVDILEQTPTDNTKTETRKTLRSALRISSSYQARPAKWLNKKRDSIMVVAILIATMAFQAGVSPPGGTWQEDSMQDSQGIHALKPHNAGESIMSYRHPKFYKNFIRANTVAFVSSLSIILLLISGLPFRRRLFMWFLMVIMWLTVSSIAITYGLAIAAITPKKDSKSLGYVIETAITVWCSVMGILLIGNTIRIINKWLKSKGIKVWQHGNFRNMIKVQVRRLQHVNKESV